MIVETVNLKEYHDNGTLWIDEIRCYVADNKIGFYGSSLIKGIDGRYFFRKQIIKYFDNGQFAWQLNCDEWANILTINPRRFRKDGTGI